MKPNLALLAPPVNITGGIGELAESTHRAVNAGAGASASFKLPICLVLFRNQSTSKATKVEN